MNECRRIYVFAPTVSNVQFTLVKGRRLLWSQKGIFREAINRKLPLEHLTVC
jgi:hypothetical protein